MPYSRVSELPANAASLPAHAKEIFLRAFNTAYDEVGETVAFRVAWAAVKQVYEKQDETWVRKIKAFMVQAYSPDQPRDESGRFGEGGGGGKESNDTTVNDQRLFVEPVKQLKQDCAKNGIAMSTEEATELVSSVKEFTKGSYREMRAEQSSNFKTDDALKDEVDNVERFIQLSPKYEGEMFRGINVDDEALASIQQAAENGGSIDMRGVSSFSSREDVAETFTNGYHNKVILRTVDGKYATPIAHASSHPEEHEVLFSGKGRLRVTGITEKNGTYVVDCEEVS